MRHYLTKLPFIFFILLALHSNSCTTSEVAKFGIQEDQLAYVPARIAVLSCKLWPVDVPYNNRPFTNLDADEINSLCTAIDEYVLGGFRGQPYMRGLSPKVVNALLKKADNLGHLDKLPKVWQQTDDSCSDCAHPITYYKETFTERKVWLDWLETFSKQAYQSDAILLPFVTYAQQGRIDDRGMIKKYLKAGLVLLLIDTGTGRLIWAGGREAIVQNKRLISEISEEPLASPTTEDLLKRLLLKDIWKDFPGRQN